MTLASTGIRRLILPTVARRALVRSSSSALGGSCGAVRQFSSEAPAAANTDPAVKVQGVSAEDLESNPNLASFFAANFEDDKASEDDADDEDELFLAMMGGAAAAAPPIMARKSSSSSSASSSEALSSSKLAAKNDARLGLDSRSSAKTP